MVKLPRPVTISDLYLAAVLDELKAIKLQLVQPEPEPVDSGEVVLKEPGLVYTPLPDDLPGKDALNEAGIVYLENVPTTGAALVVIPGIGNATANKILTWFKV